MAKEPAADASSRRTGRKKGENKGIARAHLEEKQERALIREEARVGRTTEEQLALLDKRPGESKKERARLSG